MENGATNALVQCESCWCESMPLVTMLHIPLACAYLCQDCNCIGNCAKQCPACASEVLMNLAGVLDREPEGTSQESYECMPAWAA
jgi:hypothetical protein